MTRVPSPIVMEAKTPSGRFTITVTIDPVEPFPKTYSELEYEADASAISARLDQFKEAWDAARENPGPF